jgi:hypothetical protein
MTQLPPQTQQRLSQIMETHPDRLRDSIAHSMQEPGWTGEERAALWMIGSARKKQAQDGMDLALSDPAGTSPAGDASPPPSGTPSLGVPLREQPPTTDPVADLGEEVSDASPFRE